MLIYSRHCSEIVSSYTTPVVSARSWRAVPPGHGERSSSGATSGPRYLANSYVREWTACCATCSAVPPRRHASGHPHRHLLQRPDARRSPCRARPPLKAGSAGSEHVGGERQHRQPEARSASTPRPGRHPRFWPRRLSSRRSRGSGMGTWTSWLAADVNEAPAIRNVARCERPPRLSGANAPSCLARN